MEMNFEKEVIERSQEVPVLVDFWAPWCGPCVFLGPILEELATEANGKWELVKVDVDENPTVSRDWGIRGIPDVKLFYKGRAITNFTGAMPKHQIEQWIEKNFPDERITELENIKDFRKKSGQDYDAYFVKITIGTTQFELLKVIATNRDNVLLGRDIIHLWKLELDGQNRIGKIDIWSTDPKDVI